MELLKAYINMTVSDDKMTAQLDCTEDYQADSELEAAHIQQLLMENKVVFGIDQEMIKQIAAGLPSESFPVTVAQGQPAVNGTDGNINYEIKYTSEIDRSPDWNFRDVMHIPSVQKGQKLARLIHPTSGEDGINVFGAKLSAVPGTPVLKRAGKNVVFRKEDNSFYAVSDGQLSVSDKYIQIHPVYEVNETLSMKNGNLDFVGTIIIRGDVPSGYTVKAGGDIKIHGVVEAASVTAAGSIYISEGISGQKKGFLKANENINIGYVNQGVVYAGNNLYVENSILHSECTAENHVFCQQGNIIGGMLSAGKTVEAKDIGNRLSTRTEVIFGVNKAIHDKEKKLLAKKKELQGTLEKLDTLGDKLKKQNNTNNPELRITILRHRNSYNKTKDQIEELDRVLEQMNPNISSEKDARLIVRNYIYQNAIITFGKYKRIIKTEHHFVQARLCQNEIIIHSM